MLQEVFRLRDVLIARIQQKASATASSNHLHALRRTCTSPQASIWTQRQRSASTTLRSRCGSQFF